MTKTEGTTMATTMVPPLTEASESISLAIKPIKKQKSSN
jgi:hypothetical protein